MSWPPKPASNGSFLTSLAWFYIDHCRLTVPFPVLERNQWLTEFPTSFNFETSNKQNIYNMSPEKSCFFWMHFPDRKKHEKKHVPFFFLGGDFRETFSGEVANSHPSSPDLRCHTTMAAKSVAPDTQAGHRYSPFERMCKIPHTPRQDARMLAHQYQDDMTLFFWKKGIPTIVWPFNVPLASWMRGFCRYNFPTKLRWTVFVKRFFLKVCGTAIAAACFGRGPSFLRAQTYMWVKMVIFLKIREPIFWSNICPKLVKWFHHRTLQFPCRTLNVHLFLVNHIHFYQPGKNLKLRSIPNKTHLFGVRYGNVHVRHFLPSTSPCNASSMLPRDSSVPWDKLQTRSRHTRPSTQYSPRSNSLSSKLKSFRRPIFSCHHCAVMTPPFFTHSLLVFDV